MSSNEILTRMELLRIARELVINEYIDRRAQDHNSWLANSDMAWRTQKVKLPYPAFPSYPSETDIIARANVLNEFINGPLVAPVVAPDLAPVVAPVIKKPVVQEEVAPSIAIIEKTVVQEEVAAPIAIIEKTVVQEEATAPIAIIEKTVVQEPQETELMPVIVPVAEVVIESATAVVEPESAVAADPTPAAESHYANILKIFDATEMPAPIIPVDTAVVPNDVAAIVEIFKPATSGTMESIEAVPASLSSVASAVVDAAAERYDTKADSQTSSFSSLLPNWLLKK